MRPPGARLGIINEKIALRCFSEFLTTHSPHHDLPILIEEPGIWISADRPHLAGSPDGVCNECIAVTPMDGGGVVYHCCRSLIEIKTPFKLRHREPNGEFYPLTKQHNQRCCRIPASYYDQIMGNMWMMGLSQCYFVVLTPSGFQVIVEPLDVEYCTHRLVPTLDGFFRGTSESTAQINKRPFPPSLHAFFMRPTGRFDVVLPAFDERDELGQENVYPGWLPANAGGKRPALGECTAPNRRVAMA